MFSCEKYVRTVRSRVDPKELKPAVDHAVASGKPALLDVVIDGSM
jgi:thiamine pyrophosphate-dependent acetolactate synthase large subunit-like protein